MLEKNQQQQLKNRYFFGLGTLGRDASYTMVSMYLMFYLTDILNVSTKMMGLVTMAFMVTRIFDAVNDPFMGIIVDNTKSSFGKFKPWIFFGSIAASLFTVLLFTDFHLSSSAFLVTFLLIYLLWEVSYTANDIAFWGMLPALSQDQKERERIGGVARICANIGMFAMVVGIVPLTNFIGEKVGSMVKAYQILALIAVAVMLFFQMLMLSQVKEKTLAPQQKATHVKDMIEVIFKNDQLLWITISMTLFMIGYTTTTSFGLYYFKYIFGNESMYAIFALVLGVSQITSLVAFPHLSNHFSRKKLYLIATILVVVGYLLFFLAPTNTMIFIGLAGVLIFVGQAAIQLMMLMFITDTVEYGQWKFGRRNESVTLSLQAFINKLGAAVASGIVGLTLIISGMKEANSALEMTPQGIIIFKFFMMILPLICILLGYVVYHFKYKIDAKYYQELVEKIKERESHAE